MFKIFNLLENQNSVHWNWVTLSGQDTQDFLHRITSTDVKNLALGHGCPACFLSPQGKVQSFFTLWHYQPQEYALEFESGDSNHWKTQLLSVIEQYTFGEQLSVFDVTDRLDCFWVFIESQLPEEVYFPEMPKIQEWQTLATPEGVRICHHGSKTYGIPWLSIWGEPSLLHSWVARYFPEAVHLSIRELEEKRILALQPRIDFEITRDVIPLEVGLKETIAENKGCYPGQEVIEKIIARGAPPKRLVQIQGRAEILYRGDQIYNLADPPTEIGQITSITHTENKFLALALIKKIHAKENLEVQFLKPSNLRAIICKIVAD